MTMTETTTLRHLADAMDALVKARDATRNGFLDEHVCHAMAEVREAMEFAVTSEIEEPAP